MGSCSTHRALVARLALASRVPALLIDYRLAPEHPFPAALEDAKSAYHWLLAQGIGARRIVIAGTKRGIGSNRKITAGSNFDVVMRNVHK